jgi:hypothetical protein
MVQPKNVAGPDTSFGRLLPGAEYAEKVFVKGVFVQRVPNLRVGRTLRLDAQ